MLHPAYAVYRVMNSWWYMDLAPTRASAAADDKQYMTEVNEFAQACSD